MTKKIPNQDYSTLIKFGGGVHSRASEDDIDPKECSSGQNFDLDLQNREYRNRKPFDLVGTVPNAGEIRGFINLKKSDGTISWLVQADDKVYQWDGASTFTTRATVEATAKLRGRIDHNWLLDNEVVITDLNLVDVVMKWDGTTLSDVTFTDETASDAFGVFRAKYCFIRDERVVFANIHDNGTNFPHMIIGSQRENYTVITVANLPSSALAESDPFYLIQPDFRVINGMINAFGKAIISSRDGSMFYLVGDSAKDFAFSELYANSAANGDESIVHIGNDVLYGRQGRIESLSSTDKFGDTEIDDISQSIADQITEFEDWTSVYNSRTQRVYFYPEGQNQIWVFHKPLAESGLSPWVKWVTNHSVNFDITCMMNMFDPVDGLEYVFFGDAAGNIYRMEGTGASGDGGLNDVKCERLSSLISVPLDSEAFQIDGWLEYRKNVAATVTMRFEYAGMAVFNETITLDLPAISGRNVYGGGTYYSNGSYYGTPFSQRLTRQKFGVAGGSNAFQVRVTVEGVTDFNIHSIGLKFQASS